MQVTDDMKPLAGAVDSGTDQNTEAEIKLRNQAKELEQLKLENAALQQNLAQYRSYVDNLNSTIVAINPEGIITYASPNWTNLLGHELDEVLNKPVFETFIHPDDIPANMSFMSETLSVGQKPSEIEYRIKHKDGSWRWHSSHGSPVLDAEGKVVSFLAIARDISDRKEAEQKLKESEAKYRSLYDNVLVGVFQSTFDDQYVSLNETFAKMFGYTSRDEMLTEVTDIKKQLYVNPQEREVFKQLLLENGKVQNYEVELRKKNGETFWALINARLTLDEAGKPLLIEATNIDISDFKRAEDEKYKLLTIIEHSLNEIYVFNEHNLSFEYINQGALKNIGYDMDEMRQMTPLDIKPEVDSKEFIQLLQTLKDGSKEVQQFETFHRRKDGSTYPVEVQIQLHKQGEQGKFFAIINDISESKSLKEQLFATQKMDAIGRLAGGIAHDFNNLLTVILGYSEEILDNLELNNPLRMEAEEIVKAGRRASNLTRQLLTFSRKQVTQPDIIGFNDTINNLHKLLFRLLGEDIEIEMALADDLPMIKADPGQIEQIIINLALNARDAMPKGGTLRLETGAQLLVQEDLRNHPELKAGNYACLSISDTGCGMSKEILDKVFEPFFTTKAAGKGLGLGLSTVYGIVKQSEGQVFVESEVGQGTCFKILIPATEESLDADRDPLLNKGYSGNQEQILIVEDEKALLHFLTKLIRSLGYMVSAKSSGAEALALIEGGFRPDLVLTDVVMPGMNGKELSEQIKRIVPQQKVLFMSGFTADTLLDKGIKDLEIPFIQKPFTAKDIAARIHDILFKPAPAPKRSHQILMLDDEENIRILLRRACLKRGHQFSGFGTLEETLQALSERSYDILLLDMHLFGMDGPQALNKIREAGHEIPVIVLTGAINNLEREYLQNQGVIETMEKSFDNQPLLNYVEGFLANLGT